MEQFEALINAAEQGDIGALRQLQAKVSALHGQYEAARGIIGAYLGLPAFDGDDDRQLASNRQVEIDSAAVAFLNVVL